jgi:hypothetical protein
MIKPTHYDAENYPIQWFRSAFLNTLACLNALAEDARERRVLGGDVEIRLHAYDETNRRVRPRRILRDIRTAGGKALIGLVGVQSNQFPRAVDLARSFRAAGLPVCIGGFHVSGCIAMLPETPHDLREAQALGISLFAGEAEEGRLDEVLRDAWNGRLAPLSITWIISQSAGNRRQFCRDATSAGQRIALEWISVAAVHTSAPSAPSSTCRGAGRSGHRMTWRRSFATATPRTSGDFSSPTTISPATATGKRCSSPDRVAVRRLPQDRVYHQVDTLCHRSRISSKAARARRGIIGLENVNPDNHRRQKRQNRLPTTGRCCRNGATMAPSPVPVIIGFPGDSKRRSCGTLRS